jgi:hypothetical protein
LYQFGAAEARLYLGVASLLAMGRDSGELFCSPGGF